MASATNIYAEVDPYLPDKINGYAWSSNIGWIAFQGPFIGVDVNQDTGDVTGYAWSSNIGFIKFGGLSGFPSGGGTQAVNAKFDGDNLVGWARAVRPMIPEGQTLGDWDGWISLNGDNYGISAEPLENITNGVRDFQGFAWGSDVVGWVNFTPPADNTEVTTSGGCSPAGGSCGRSGGNLYCTIGLQDISPIEVEKNASVTETRTAHVVCSPAGLVGDVTVTPGDISNVSVSPEEDNCTMTEEGRACSVDFEIIISGLENSSTLPITASYQGQNVSTNINIAVQDNSQCTISKTTERVGRNVTWSVPNVVSGYTYEWTGDATGEDSTVTKSFSEIGSKTATVTVRDSEGNFVFECSKTVKIIKGPIIEEF